MFAGSLQHANFSSSYSSFLVHRSRLNLTSHLDPRATARGGWKTVSSTQSCCVFGFGPDLFSLLHRFATELAGRKARRAAGAYDGLAREMRRAGWFGST